MSPMPQPLRLKTKDDDLTWVQRLKKLEKKDVAAVGACLMLLGVLPVIEQVINNGSDEGKLSQGFAVPGGGSGSGQGGEGFEPGVGSGAPGGLPGQAGGEVITPMAGRDPTSLVMGLGGNAPKSPGAGAGGAGAQTGGLKDAMAESMRRAMPEVTKSAANPVPTARLTTSLANLLGGGGGAGSGASSAGLKPSGDILNAAKGEPGRGPGSNKMAYSGSMPGYKGVGARGLNDTSGLGEKLKAQADAAASKFNRGDARSDLFDASKASGQIDSGTPGGSGAGPSNDADAKKATLSPSTSKQDRSFGQGLDQQKDMARWQKELDNCYKKKESYGSSFSGGMWALMSGNLFSSTVDCSEIPDWINGPGGKFLDSFVGDKLLSNMFSKPFENIGKAGGKEINKILGFKTKDCIAYRPKGATEITVDCSDPATYSCDDCDANLNWTTIGKCAYEGVTTGETEEKGEKAKSSKTKGTRLVGDMCTETGDSAKDKTAKSPNDHGSANTEQVGKQNMANLDAAKKAQEQGGPVVTPKVEKGVQDTTGELEKARLFIAKNDQQLQPLLQTALQADSEFQMAAKDLANHCVQHATTNHVSQKDVNVWVGKCIDNHEARAVAGDMHDPPAIPHRYAAARKGRSDAWQTWATAKGKSDACAAQRDKIIANPKSKQTVGDQILLVAQPEDLEKLKEACKD